MEGAAAALVVVALELGEVKVLIQRLQLGQSLLQRFRRVGEPGKVAESIGIDHIGHFHQIGARSRELCVRIIEVSGEKYGVAARVTVVGRRRIRRVVCVADAAVRSHVSHAAAQTVLREAQVMIVAVMRRFRFRLNLVDV